MNMKTFIFWLLSAYIIGISLGAFIFNGLYNFECTHADTYEGKERCIIYERIKNE